MFTEELASKARCRRRSLPSSRSLPRRSVCWQFKFLPQLPSRQVLPRPVAQVQLNAVTVFRYVKFLPTNLIMFLFRTIRLSNIADNRFYSFPEAQTQTLGIPCLAL